MKFDYFKLSNGILRPIIPIKLSHGDGEPIKYFALIDSGADKCFAAAEVAIAVGVEDLKSVTPEQIGGINGLSDAYFH